MKEKTLLRWALAFVFCCIEVFGTHLLQADEPSGIRSSSVRLPVTFKAPGKGFASLALYDKKQYQDALTKLDGSAKGGIAVAIAHELGLPVKLIGVGEKLEDLRPFDANDFARALVSG